MSRAERRLGGESWFRARHESQVGRARRERPAQMEFGVCPQMTQMGRR
jgi:hypothetical protein